MDLINDIARPDIAKVEPKMSEIRDLAIEELKDMIPFINVRCSDNLMSATDVVGSFDPKSIWANQIFLNSRCFRFSIIPANECRYYQAGQKVTLELSTKHHKIDAKFRKVTTTPEKAVAKIKAWILATKESLVDHQ